jgi:hypothetical protein
MLALWRSVYEKSNNWDKKEKQVKIIGKGTGEQINETRLNLLFYYIAVFV